MSGRIKITLAFSISIVILVSIGAYAYKTANEYKKSSDWVLHSEMVISGARDMMLDIQNVETAQRGYVITGEDRYLEPYRIGRNGILSTRNRLRKLVRDNLAQVRTLDSVYNDMRVKIRFAESVIYARKHLGYEKAQQMVLSGRGENLMKVIRNRMNRFISNEEKILSKRSSISSRHFSASLSVINTSIISAVIVILIALYFYIQDHNRRLRSENELRKTSKQLQEAIKIAEDSALLKEAFLANMSHEIRTPMNAILGYTDILMKSKLPEKDIEYVGVIKNSGENLLRIINDILDVSKMESGMMTFETHSMSITDIFSSLDAMLQPKAKQKGISLEFSCDKQLPVIVEGDPTRLTQIILNLVSNAIKFTSQGNVLVRATLVNKTDDNYKVEFLVQDTGIGIPEDKLEHIFERFRQAETHTTRHYGGTGLGLSIARQLVELQGGTIKVDSKLNQGSVFTFVLPFGKTKTSFKNNGFTAIKPQQELGALNLLLVEDNPVNVKLMMSLFSFHNIVPDLAGNGKIAVEKVKSKSYDLVLMDIEMPEMNGYQAAQAIREELKNNVPIIAMTAHAMAGEREKCIQAGMNEYLSKPIREELLIEKITEVLAAAKTPVIEMTGNLVKLDFLINTMRGSREAIVGSIDVFLEQFPEDIASVNVAVESEDRSRIKRAAHHMKSTVNIMGIDSMTAQLQEMELLATSEGPMEKIKELNQLLAQNYSAVMDEMMEWKRKFS